MSRPKPLSASPPLLEPDVPLVGPDDGRHARADAIVGEDDVLLADLRDRKIRDRVGASVDRASGKAELDLLPIGIALRRSSTANLIVVSGKVRSAFHATCESVARPRKIRSARSTASPSVTGFASARLKCMGGDRSYGASRTSDSVLRANSDPGRRAERPLLVKPNRDVDKEFCRERSARVSPEGPLLCTRFLACRTAPDTNSVFWAARRRIELFRQPPSRIRAMQRGVPLRAILRPSSLLRADPRTTVARWTTRDDAARGRSWRRSGAPTPARPLRRIRASSRRDKSASARRPISGQKITRCRRARTERGEPLAAPQPGLQIAQTIEAQGISGHAPNGRWRCS